MGVELTPRETVENLMAKYGCLGGAPDGPMIEHFDPIALAQGLEQEVQRAALVGWQKITLHMDVADALKLARKLRG